MLLPLVAPAFFVPHGDTTSSSLFGKQKSQKKLIDFTSFLAASSGQNPAENDSSSEGGDRSDDAPTDPSNAPSDPSNKKYSVARAGGRRSRTDSKSRHDVTKNTRSGNDIFSVFRQYALPLCLLTVIIKLLLGMFGGDVVYYSRSVYQSTTYSQDGNVETIRKENFQSNVPGLIEKAKDYSQEQNGGDERYLDSIDEELMDLEDEIGSLFFNKW